MTRGKPRIGVTLDVEERSARYSLRARYCAAVAEAGGLAFCLPHETRDAGLYAGWLDGLLVTGGAFDIDPALFGAESRHATVQTKAERTGFELAVAKAMLALDKPVLGICGGAQLLNVVFGGSLIQHIEDEVADSLLHEQPNPRTEPGHRVTIAPGTLLHRIAGAESLAVNSAHHQAVKDVGKGLRANAVAPDGVIEGVEAPGKRFCLGVQWHPELAVSTADRALFAAFVAAAPA